MMEAREILLTGTYDAMRSQCINLQYENFTLKNILREFLHREKRTLEEAIKEMESKNENSHKHTTAN